MKHRIYQVAAGLILVCLLATLACAEERLMLFCGAGFQKPTEEVIAAFTGKTGLEVNANFASVGTILSQVGLTRQGDLLIVPSPDNMEKAQKKGFIVPATVKSLGFVVPAINVQKGNPKNIRRLKDLTRPDVRLAIANPESVFIGALAVEIMEKGLSPEEKGRAKKNIVTYADDLSRLATFLVLHQVDAIIGFSYLSGWYPDKIETVRLSPNEVHRIGAGQVAVLSHSNNRPGAEKFIDFLTSAEGRSIFNKYHYFSSYEEATAWVGAQKPVGGEYHVPREWVGK